MKEWYANEETVAILKKQTYKSNFEKGSHIP